MKLFSQKGKPVETASPGNDGSKLPIVPTLVPGVLPLGEVPAALDALGKELSAKYLGIPVDPEQPILEQTPHLARGEVKSVLEGSIRHGGVNPRLDLSQYPGRVPIQRPVKFEQGEILIIEGCKFKIMYIRSNPSRMTLEAI